MDNVYTHFWKGNHEVVHAHGFPELEIKKLLKTKQEAIMYTSKEIALLVTSSSSDPYFPSILLFYKMIDWNLIFEFFSLDCSSSIRIHSNSLFITIFCLFSSSRASCTRNLQFHYANIIVHSKTFGFCSMRDKKK